MGAALAELHHAFDAPRFMVTDDMEAGYRGWLGKELKNPGAVVLVAELDGDLCGYAYGRLEDTDWNALLDKHGGFHDLWVDPPGRRQGAGRLLSGALVARLKALGAPRVVLMSAAQNLSAQRLFASLGFRPTMVEMTLEAGHSVTSAAT